MNISIRNWGRVPYGNALIGKNIVGRFFKDALKSLNAIQGSSSLTYAARGLATTRACVIKC